MEIFDSFIAKINVSSKQIIILSILIELNFYSFSLLSYQNAI